jgi:ATP-binding cassette, subfamily A (ABC1), member 3
LGLSYSSAITDSCHRSGQTFRDPLYCSRFGGYGYTIQYNYTALHIAPLLVNLADQALIRNALRSHDFHIDLDIHPLPITNHEDAYGESEDAFSAWFLIVLSFPFITGAFATFIVEERESKAKHLQTVAGVQPSAYWLSTFCWDMANYQFPLWITIILFLVFNVDVLTTRDHNVLSGVIAILLLYGPASSGFAYCVSFAFSSASLCNVFIIIFGFLIGMGGPVTCYILIVLGKNPYNLKPNLVNAAKIITWVLRFTPSFCLGNGLFHVINIEVFNFYEGHKLDAFSEPILLVEVIFLVLQTFGWMLLAIQLDKWSNNPRMVGVWQAFLKVVTCQLRCASPGPETFDITIALPEDSDVLAEQSRVLEGGANSDLIVISQLTKVYDNGKKAVNNLSLGIPHGQCFGLLGINGAGKTTTMQMLTAEFPPTNGDATLAGYSVTCEPEKTRRRIGYCPQFDAHFANMTGREHVELYASIKGIPRDCVKEAAAAKLQEVGLSEKDSDALSSSYSGGMKRRLSLACAIIGQPQIVFLDECSTGVDPVARREIWQLISDMVADGRIPADQRTSVILTTHSMEGMLLLCST